MESPVSAVEGAIRDAAERVGPAVVGLGRGWGLGTGVVVADGRILTNSHNLRGEEVTVTFADGRRAVARVAGIDADLDVAALEVDTTGAPAVRWSPDASTTTIGSAVFALGNPGGRGLRVTLGFVSAADRRFRGPGGRRIAGAIEHTAPLPRGSSGGPLVDAGGGLLGLNTVRQEGGLILAVPADETLARHADALWKGQRPVRPRLGVAVAPLRVARRLRRAVGLPERDGILVRAVDEGSAAGRAGVEPGDLIVAAGGRPIAGVDDLYEALDQATAGAKLRLTVVRGTDERDVEVSLDADTAGV
ncbi:MAG: S1C family serine protease [Solirubrobacteraceae bacterium]